MKRRIRIRRTDGSYSEFDLDVNSYTTVLDALEHVRSKADRTLVYRHSCHHGSCGTCAAVINGRPALMCLTRLAGPEEVTIVEPLVPFSIEADLATDPTPFYADFPKDAGYLRLSEAGKDAEPPPEVETYTRFENCIECGLCVSACPVEGRFLGPAALAAYSRELEKQPEREAEILEAVGKPEGAPRCERALECSRVCPLGVNPARHIAVLRRKLDARRSE